MSASLVSFCLSNSQDHLCEGVGVAKLQLDTEAMTSVVER